MTTEKKLKELQTAHLPTYSMLHNSSVIYQSIVNVV